VGAQQNRSDEPTSGRFLFLWQGKLQLALRHFDDHIADDVGGFVGVRFVLAHVLGRRVCAGLHVIEQGFQPFDGIIGLLDEQLDKVILARFKKSDSQLIAISSTRRLSQPQGMQKMESSSSLRG